MKRLRKKLVQVFEKSVFRVFWNLCGWKSFCYCCIVLVGWTITTIFQLQELRRNVRDFYFFGKWHATWETFTFSGIDTQRKRLLLFREMTRNVRDFYIFEKWHATWETFTFSRSDTQRERFLLFREMTRNVRDFYVFGKCDTQREKIYQFEFWNCQRKKRHVGFWRS